MDSKSSRDCSTVIPHHPLGFCQHFFVARASFSTNHTGTNRAAALLLSGPGVYGSLPDMTLSADPPNLFVRSCRDHLGSQGTVQRWMPLCRDFWLRSSQIIEPGQDLFPCTVRTARFPNGPHPYLSRILVPKGTDPPDAPFTCGCDLGRQQRSIFCRVPLPRHLRKLRCHVVCSRHNHPSGTDRASSPVQCAGLDGNAPLVTFFTPPPDFTLGAGGHFPGRQRAIFRRVPLLSQFRKLACQIIAAGRHRAVSTYRAAAALYTGADFRLPFMAQTAPPPHLLLTSRQYMFRSERKIGVLFPLIQQLLPPFPYAEIMQAFPHGQSPFYAESTFCIEPALSFQSNGKNGQKKSPIFLAERGRKGAESQTAYANYACGLCFCAQNLKDILSFMSTPAIMSVYYFNM